MADFGAQDAVSYLTQNGFSPVQAAALAGNMQQESGFDPTNLNKGEGAYGLIQWRGDRLQGLKNYASAWQRDPADPKTQMDFIKQEMASSEGQNSKDFLNATDLPSANAALKKYIRYDDNSQDTRLKYASALLGGQQPQNALTSAGINPMNLFNQSASNILANGSSHPNPLSAYRALQHLWSGNPITVIDADGRWRTVRPISHNPF